MIHILGYTSNSEYDYDKEINPQNIQKWSINHYFHILWKFSANYYKWYLLVLWSICYGILLMVIMINILTRNFPLISIITSITIDVPMFQWWFPGIGVPPVIIHFHRIFPNKPSILGYPLCWKPPNAMEPWTLMICASMLLTPGAELRAQLKKEYFPWIELPKLLGCFMKTITGWWFGCHCLFSHILGMIIPIDELIFFRGVAKNHQPD